MGFSGGGGGGGGGGATQITPKDRVYCALPLYHSAGGACGTGMMYFGGATLVLRRKFSASQYACGRAGQGAGRRHTLSQGCRGGRGRVGRTTGFGRT